MNIKDFFSIAVETFKQFNEDKAPRLAAALAYFTIFSIAPLLIIVIAIAGAVFGREAAQGQVMDQVQGMVGETGGQVIEDMLQNANQNDGGTFATIVSVVTLVLGASGVFLQLQDALNTIWGVMPNPRAGIMHMIKSRILSFSLVVGVGFLLLVSLVISAALAAFDQFLNNAFPGGGVILQLINLGISIVVITLMFAVIFKYLPDVEISWNDVWIGALTTAILFNIGKFAIGLYIGNSSVASVYGAAGSLVVLLIWIYYSSLILFFGAEFTQVYARRYGSNIRPADNAIPLTAEARARQGIPKKQDVEAAADLAEARNR